jgi:speckle-type POZ protein
VILKGDDANAVKAMLKFMYTSDYDAADNSSSPMVFNAIVYRIADKYMVPALKSLAQRKIQELVSTSWDSDDFTDYIAQLYNLPDISDQVLREMVIEVVRKHNQQLVLKPKFCDILNGTAEFASDLAMCMITKGNPSVVTHRCAWCEQTFDCRQCHSCSDTWNAG